MALTSWPQVSQGEVVKFASNACKLMGEAGVSVLLEGREQTVNYIESPYRFELVRLLPCLEQEFDHMVVMPCDTNR